MSERKIPWSTNEHYKPSRTPELVYFIVDGPSYKELLAAKKSGRTIQFKAMAGMLKLKDCQVPEAETVIDELLKKPFDLMLRINEVSPATPDDADHLSVDAVLDDIKQVLPQGICAVINSQIRHRTALWVSYNAKARTGGFALGSHSPIINAYSTVEYVTYGSLEYYQVKELALH